MQDLYVKNYIKYNLELTNQYLDKTQKSLGCNRRYVFEKLSNKRDQQNIPVHPFRHCAFNNQEHTENKRI